MAETAIQSTRLLRHGEPAFTGEAAVIEAARLLATGEVVAVPTDTVYGLAADLTSDAALSEIFRIKGRARTQTLPILVHDRAAAGQLIRHDGGVNARDAERLLILAERFWPGGLTVALPARPDLPPAVVADDVTVGLRVPDNEVTRVLLRLTGGAMAVTSANRSGEAPLTDASSVARELGSAGLRWVLDGGPSGLAVPSTVIGQIDGDLVIHRLGAIPERDLRRVWSDTAGLSDRGAR